MIDIENSRVYLNQEHYEELKNEDDYVKKRYNAVVLMTLQKPIGITRKDGAKLIGVGKRQTYRILAKFRQLGIKGLRKESTRPKTMPKITPKWLEHMVTTVRQVTGLGNKDVSTIVNTGLKRNGSDKAVYPSLVGKMLVRCGIIHRPEPPKKNWKHFDWKRANNLIQADLTEMNTVPILTMEDDHTRKAWASVVPDERANTITTAMDRIGPEEYNNLLTDNGRQFTSHNPFMREYCETHVNKRHIHASVRHPQTMGKLSRYQRGLKEFLLYHLGESRNRTRMAILIKMYNLLYNNGRLHTATEKYPEEDYSGKVNEKWFDKLVKYFKLENVLSPC